MIRCSMSQMILSYSSPQVSTLDNYFDIVPVLFQTGMLRFWGPHLHPVDVAATVVIFTDLL